VSASIDPQVTMCDHIVEPPAEPRSGACEECGETENLRLCTKCGHVGCCESLNRHGEAHYLATGHPVIKALPLERSWFTWCYECRRYVDFSRS
jgi:uncharacterized UBP type Zn finger protein